MEEVAISENPLRAGNFTSSSVHKLIKTGAGGKGFSTTGLTYIEEKRIERKMGITLKQDVYSRTMAWGHLIEKWVHEKHLTTAYSSVGTETISHPTIPFWKGSPDFKCESKQIVAECKGYERKKFAEYAEVISRQDTEIMKIVCPEEYWQLVSNAAILEYDKIQPILCMPFKSELSTLQEFVDNLDTPNQWMFKYVSDAVLNGNYSSLPYLPDGCEYKNLYTCILDAPKADVDFLTERILQAEKLI